MKFFSFLSLLCIIGISWHFSLVAEQRLFMAPLKNGMNVDIIKITPDDKYALSRCKEIFVKTFLEVYAGYTAEQLYLKDKSSLIKIIEDSINNEENNFNAKKDGLIFVVVKDVQNSEIVGFASYEIIEKESEMETVYISQLAVDSAYRRQGIGKVLIVDTIKKIVYNKPTIVSVCTRDINKSAINFYYKLGFQDAPIEGIHPELPKYIWHGLKLILN